MTERADRAAELLLQARQTRQRLATLPADCMPETAAEAYAVQMAHVARLLATYGGTAVGYKCGCTSAAAQRHLGVEEPFHGRLLSPVVHASPARFPADSLFMCVIEVEFGFRMGDDLPPAAAPYDPDGVAAAVDAVLPAVEIVDSRYQAWTEVGADLLIADNGCQGAWVHGEPVTDWRDLDLEAEAVSLTCNGKLVREGVGANALGHPLNALTWIANTLCLDGGGLKRGDLVSTGTCIEVYDAARGDRLVADHGAVGRVEVTLV